VELYIFKKKVLNEQYIKKKINLLHYFTLCPSRSAKHNRLKRIKNYYELRDFKAHLASDNSILGKDWKNFLIKWQNL